MRSLLNLACTLGRSLLLTTLLLVVRSAYANLTVLIGEPFGSSGTMMPLGHAAIYLDRVCADGPLQLRMCRANEQPGVAIARYHRMGRTDWVASPIMQFLYATDRADEVLPYATPTEVRELRQRYRRRFIPDLVPDGREMDKASDEWWETAGVAYIRRQWGYQIDTTVAQDEQFVAAINARPNRHHFHLLTRNCANFAADVVNFYFPGAVKGGDHIADFGLMTPKQVARSVYAYGKRHPEAELKVMEIPQVPGSLLRSRPVRGAAEAGLKTKRYLATLAVIQPEIVVGLAVLYLDHGRWQIGNSAQLAEPAYFERQADE